MGNPDAEFMNFNQTLATVSNRGTPPVSFLTELLAWAQTADDALFAPNTAVDAYSLMRPVLGPWQGPLHRKGAMLELMRVHGGFESSWNWDEGVDTTNAASLANLAGQETGLWQVSQDSLNLDLAPDCPLHSCIGKYGDGLCSPEQFIPLMKSNHPLAMEYYVRLVRITCRWAGPLISINGNPPAVLAWLSRDAVAEWETLLGPSA